MGPLKTPPSCLGSTGAPAGLMTQSASYPHDSRIGLLTSEWVSFPPADPPRPPSLPALSYSLPPLQSGVAQGRAMMSTGPPGIQAISVVPRRVEVPWPPASTSSGRSSPPASLASSQPFSLTSRSRKGSTPPSATMRRSPRNGHGDLDISVSTCSGLVFEADRPEFSANS